MLHKNCSWVFYFIRHAESELNLCDVVGGKCITTPLTPRGRLQAAALEERLQGIVFDRVYTSTAVRTYDTCRLALPSYPADRIIQVSALDEIDLGDWEAKPRQQVYDTETLVYLGRKGETFTPPNGESQRMVERRVSTWLDDEFLHHKDFIENNPHAAIACFSHAITIKVILHSIMHFGQEHVYKMSLDNASVSEVVFSERGWSVRCINDTAHMRKIDYRV
ncbi:histidine phosphatase family protein [Candidatus Woesearchaeota archaeon]|nr:histidine phosphatase family protein [Candidatus Woesearchaeota archaeon]